MQRKQRFVADQRWDLPHYEKMLGYIDAEFNSFNKAFLSPENKIIKGWTVENAGGLSVRINQSTDSLLLNSKRTGKEGFILRNSNDDVLSINLADNATNYVEIHIVSGLCAPDTVAIWDTTANGGQGEEFTQTVETVDEEQPRMVANTIAFSGDSDKVPVAIVTTSGGVITNIDTNVRDLFFHLGDAWNFGVTRTDKNIGNIKEMYDALSTSILELKGAVAWYDKPWSSLKLLREYQNIFWTGGGTIQWEGPAGVNNLGWSQPIGIELAGRSGTYSISPATVTLAEGQCVHVDIPEGVPGGPLTAVVSALDALPINPASGGTGRTMVLFFRRSGKIFGAMDIPDLDPGEAGSIGQDLPQLIRARLGITGENSYAGYSSTTNIAPTDNYAQAISKLDAAIRTIQTDLPQEETFIVPPLTGSSVSSASYTATHNFDIGLTIRYGATFIPNRTGVLAQVKVPLSVDSGSPSDSVVVDVYAASGANLPTGAVLSTSSPVSTSALPSTALGLNPTLTTFTFSGGATLTSGQKYAFVARRLGSGAIQIKTRNADVNPASTMVRSTDGGATWETIVFDTSFDVILQTNIGAYTVFTSNFMQWSTTNSLVDIQVFLNGRKIQQSLTGALDEDYRKTSSTTLEFAYPIPPNARITVRSERTGGGGGSGGGSTIDLENLIVNPQPDVNGSRGIGTNLKAFSACFIKDENSAQVYKLHVQSGVFKVTAV